MRRLLLWVAIALGVPGVARADRYDFRLYQLGAPSSDPAANARFAAFANELGVAIANWNLEPPETTGYSGFNFAFEYPVSLINDKGTLNGIRYWPLDPNTTGTGALQMPGIHVRNADVLTIAQSEYLDVRRVGANEFDTEKRRNAGGRVDSRLALVIPVTVARTDDLRHQMGLLWKQCGRVLQEDLRVTDHDVRDHGLGVRTHPERLHHL